MYKSPFLASFSLTNCLKIDEKNGLKRDRSKINFSLMSLMLNQGDTNMIRVELSSKNLKVDFYFAGKSSEIIASHLWSIFCLIVSHPKERRRKLGSGQTFGTSLLSKIMLIQ